jgi:D-glycero-beta-D-manno-heptose-7-phosphate kinase
MDLGAGIDDLVARISHEGSELSADLNRLTSVVEAFPQQRVVLLGDFVADQYVSGEISRVSREAPVLIIKHRETQLVPGGGANAANNLAALGSRILPISAVGDDESGRGLVEYFERAGVDVRNISRVRDWTTPTKSRYLAGWTHKSGQQVLRVDREPASSLSDLAQKQLIERASRLAKKAGAMLVSDYGFGAATPAMVRAVRRAAGTKLIVTLDSRYSLGNFGNAGVTAATPNEGELESLYHTRIGNDLKKLDDLGRRTVRSLGLQALLVTRGKDGMVLFEKGCAAKVIPIFGSTEGADVTGAGDTVIAVFTLALAAGAGFYEAAVLANYAGGIVVMKHGTATVSRAELLDVLRRESTGGAKVDD